MTAISTDSPQSPYTVPVPHLVFPDQGLIENHPSPADSAHKYIGRVKTVSGSAGTGTLVQVLVDQTWYRVVVTAAHVIYHEISSQDAREMTAEAYFTPAYCPGSAPGMGPNPPSAPYGIYAVGEADMFVPERFKTHDEDRDDYGVLLIDQEPREGLDKPPLLGGGRLVAGEAVEVYGYPGISDGNMAGGTGTVLEVRDGLVHHNASAGPGSSGAPVMRTGDLLHVFALYTRGHRSRGVNLGPELSSAVINEIADWIQSRQTS